MGLRKEHEAGEDCVTICTAGDQMKEDKMGEACGTSGKRGQAHKGLWKANLKKTAHLKRK